MLQFQPCRASHDSQILVMAIVTDKSLDYISENDTVCAEVDKDIVRTAHSLLRVAVVLWQPETLPVADDFTSIFKAGHLRHALHVMERDVKQEAGATSLRSGLVSARQWDGASPPV